MYKEEHNIFREAFRKFLATHVIPHIDEWEEKGEVPRDAWMKMGQAGFLCPWLPEKYGGSEADFLYSVIIAEELAKSGAVSFMVPLHSDIVAPYIFRLGTERQKVAWLPRCARGEIILAIAMTEPGAGSDLAAIRTTATLQGNKWIINGQKTFISNGATADLIVVACKTDKSVPAHKGISLICVESNSPGFRRGKKLKKMGLHAQDTAELFFEDCRVPEENILGEPNKGFYYMMEHLQQERIIAAVTAQAMAERMFEITLNYCKERAAFGQMIGKFQHNTFKLVDMATEIELGKTFLEKLVRKHMEGKDVAVEASMAKSWICEMANRVAYRCVQLHGGYGYMEEYPICRFYRDVRVFPIFAGTTEIMKLIIAKHLGLA